MKSSTAPTPAGGNATAAGAGLDSLGEISTRTLRLILGVLPAITGLPIPHVAADDGRCLDWGRRSTRQLTTRSMEANYVNEQGDTGSEVAERDYGADKYRRLGALKARFDGNNLFRLNQNVLPVPAT